MDDKWRCQSCGMPLADAWLGTNADGTSTREYCQMCFKDGVFTEPKLTLEGMIAKSVNYMSTQMNFTREAAEQMSRDVMPQLRRWKS